MSGRRLRGFLLAGAAIVAAAVVLFVLSMPARLSPKVLAGLSRADAAHGEEVFWASGCAACHAQPGVKSGDRPVLSGGLELKSGFGTFVVPNISPDPVHGIGKWTLADFANAVMRGVSPGGRNYYPAFPYTSFSRMHPQDVADLFAYLKTLPPSANDPRETSLAFPYSIRRGVDLWKWLYLHPGTVVSFNSASDIVRRGQYLVEGPGHCGECHTPRNAIGGQVLSKWLSGARMPDGKGKAPNITPHRSGIGDWTAPEMVSFFQTGFTPDFDSVGGAMVEVQENLAHLPKSDLEAIAAYLKAIPPLPSSAGKDSHSRSEDEEGAG
mgnify:CR=1 FL=1